jgi:hypothetical protein
MDEDRADYEAAGGGDRLVTSESSLGSQPADARSNEDAGEYPR